MDYQSYIEQLPIESSLFAEFCKKATRSEFLEYQVPFFYAVKAFPRMLSSLAAQIFESNIRLKVIENLWEEHGRGREDGFHTASFLTFLRALGFDQKEEIPKNFFVENWVLRNLDSRSLNAEAYAARLAGIEYVYARISQMVCETIEKFPLSCPQSHYTRHASLDYDHAQDLLWVAQSLSSDEDMIFKHFSESATEFLDLFNQMTFLTSAQVREIANKEISFFFGREDSEVELGILKDFPHGKKDILIVCSGGEHVIQIKKRYPDSNIVAFDINPHQINLAIRKISEIQKNGSFQAMAPEGKFESLFQVLARKLSDRDLAGIAKSDIFSLEKLRLICLDIFSRKNLEMVFTARATQYTRKDFSEHFFNTFKSQIAKYQPQEFKSSNIGSVLGKDLPMDYPAVLESSNITFLESDLNGIDLKMNGLFDLISLSNVGDWMAFEELEETIMRSKKLLKPGGVIVLRKLLGDYDIEEVFSRHFSEIISHEDGTEFYSSCYSLKC